jgi:hypothetical protein
MKEKEDNVKRKERFERVRIAPVTSDLILEKIEDPVNPGVEATVSMSSDLFDFDTSKFDLMQVRITVYSLSGILRTIPKKDRKKRHSFCGRKSSKSIKASANFVDTLRDAPPVTAVVSCMRNVNGSSNSIETFLPSTPFESDETVLGNTSRLMATWPAANSNILLETEPADQSTFTLIRVMKHEPYRRGTRANHISYYIPETIDLRISIGCGKSLCFIGIASFVITGDEEGEVTMNIPAKRVPDDEHPQTKGHSSASSRSKGSDKAAPSGYEPTKCYKLDENATLKVGVQVLPQNEYFESRKKTVEEKERQDNDFKKLLTGIFDGLPEDADDQFLFKQEDMENVAIIQNVPPELLEAKAKAAAKQSNVVQPLETAKAESSLPKFFCDAMTGAIEVCSASSKPDVKPAVESVPRNINANSNLMLPLSLVSSVSESLTASTASSGHPR